MPAGRAARCQHLGHVGVDRGRAGGHRDRHPVMTVLDEVQVADPVHVDRRDRLAAPLGQRQPLPALPHPARWSAGTGGRSPGCESTVPTIVSSRIVCRPSRRSPRQPRAATTSSNGRMRLTSSGSRRSRWASRASTWRRRTRRKSFSTSARGKPVSAGIALPAARESRPTARAGAGVARPARSRPDLEQVPAGHVADERAAQPDGPGAHAVRVHVPVQQHGRAAAPRPARAAPRTRGAPGRRRRRRRRAAARA